MKFSSSGGAPAGIRLTQAARAGEGSTLSLQLRPGTGQAVAVAPPALSPTSPYSLHVVAPQGSSCAVTATSRGKTVNLGTVTDPDRDGTLVGKGALAARLGKGSWKLSTVCRSGATTTRSTSTVTVSG